MTRILTAAVLATLALPATAQDATEGQRLYLAHCATCHGLDAAGGGPMAPSLLLQPPDLTRLTERNDGTFPVTRIVTRIDGRDPLTSHGSPMPVYGDFFEGNDTAVKSEAGQPILTSRPIVDLLAWLAAVQQ